LEKPSYINNLAVTGAYGKLNIPKINIWHAKDLKDWEKLNEQIEKTAFTRRESNVPVLPIKLFDTKLPEFEFTLPTPPQINDVAASVDLDEVEVVGKLPSVFPISKSIKNQENSTTMKPNNTDNTYNNSNPPINKNAQMLRAMPVFGNALGVLFSALDKPNYSNIQRTENYYHQIPTISARPIGNRMVYTPLDINYLMT